MVMIKEGRIKTAARNASRSGALKRGVRWDKEDALRGPTAGRGVIELPATMAPFHINRAPAARACYVAHAGRASEPGSLRETQTAPIVSTKGRGVKQRWRIRWDRRDSLLRRGDPQHRNARRGRLTRSATRCRRAHAPRRALAPGWPAPPGQGQRGCCRGGIGAREQNRGGRGRAPAPQ